MSEEMFDIERPQVLIDYLRSCNYIEPNEQPKVTVLSGGVSNRTVLVERASGEAWVIKQALPKLRVQVDWFSSPERIFREAAGLTWLAQIAPEGTIPAPVFEDRERYLLAMQAVPQPHENWKQMLLDGRLEFDHIDQFARLLATIHLESHRVGTMLKDSFDRSFFLTLRIEPFYQYTATQVPDAALFLHRLVDDTLALELALTHGDYSPKNILVYQNRLILLDHEVIHFGDPAFDLGFSMAHLLSKAHHLAHARPRFLKAINRYWNVYHETLGPVTWADGLEARAARHALGCALARVAGRSTVEYLDAEARVRQRDAVSALMQRPPTTIAELTGRFGDELQLR